MSVVSPHRRRRSDDEGHAAGMERWLLTYSDMITLLLALFVVLFAIASVNRSKLIQVERSIRKSVNSGGLSATGSQPSQSKLRAPSASSRAPKPKAIPASALAEIEAEIHRALAERGLLGDVNLKLESRGLIIRLLADKVFYATNSATLTSVGQQVVDTAGAVLARHDNAVLVEGYTDDQPVLGPPFYSNWELSAARAVNVVLRLDHSDGVSAGRLVAEGFGSSHPIVPNTSPANMAENRRVNIVVLATTEVRQ